MLLERPGHVHFQCHTPYRECIADVACNTDQIIKRKCTFCLHLDLLTSQNTMVHQSVIIFICSDTFVFLGSIRRCLESGGIEAHHSAMIAMVPEDEDPSSRIHVCFGAQRLTAEALINNGVRAINGR